MASGASGLLELNRLAAATQQAVGAAAAELGEMRRLVAKCLVATGLRMRCSEAMLLSICVYFIYFGLVAKPGSVMIKV